MIWLYQTVRIEHLGQQEVDNLFAKMGKDTPVGWELVTVHNGLAYFKKPDIRAVEYERERMRISRVRGRRVVREFMEAVDGRRPGSQMTEQGSYSYETVQNGYVIFDSIGKKVEPWDLVKILDKALELSGVL